MAYICPFENKRCSECSHYRFEKEENRFACFGAYDEAHNVGSSKMRTLVALLEVDDNRAIAEDMGTIDYIEREMGWVHESGIYLSNIKILDDDDPEDEEVIKLVDKIFD